MAAYSNNLQGKVLLNGQDVCLEQVKAGMAWHYKDYQAEQSAEDRKIYADEIRYVMMGMSSLGLLFVSFTYRYDVVRLISARRAEKWMVKVYEDEK